MPLFQVKGLILFVILFTGVRASIQRRKAISFSGSVTAGIFLTFLKGGLKISTGCRPFRVDAASDGFTNLSLQGCTAPVVLAFSAFHDFLKGAEVRSPFDRNRFLALVWFGLSPVK